LRIANSFRIRQDKKVEKARSFAPAVMFIRKEEKYRQESVIFVVLGRRE
jgi:hypothetical protein